MAETTVTLSAGGSGDDSSGLWGPYWISPLAGMVVTHYSGSDVRAIFTTDGGATWDETTVITAATIEHLACWFDRETPGDGGNLIHVTYSDSATPDVSYRNVNVLTQAMSTEVAIDTGVTVSATNADNRSAITKTRSGNLIVAFDTDNEIECYRSVDGGASWVDIADVYETTGAKDWCLLYPASTDDDDDACAIFWDASADAISTKMWDNSAGTWTETAVLSSMIEDVTHISMDAAVRHSDGMIFGAAHEDEASSGDDLQTFTVLPNSIASPVVAAGTNIYDNEAQSSQCAVLIHQPTGNIYVAWLGGGTWQTSVSILYKISTDSMATWGSEVQYNTTDDDYRRVQSGRTVGGTGGRYLPVFFDDDDTDVYCNDSNGLTFGAVGSTGRKWKASVARRRRHGS